MIKFIKINESYVKISCSDDIAMNLAMAFSTYSPGYEFDHRYKSGVWDGRIYQFDYNNDTIPLGLTYKCAKYINQSLKLKTNIANDILVKADLFSDNIIKQFIINKLGHTKFEPYDYQLNAIRNMIFHRRLTVECATGSGKSFIIAVVVCMLLTKYALNKILIVTPDVSLVHQMISDFDSYYGFEGKFSDKYICNYRAKKKNYKAPIHIANVGQLANKKNNFFTQFDCVIGDECHSVRNNKIKQYSSIFLNCINAVFKFGLCGKIPDNKGIMLNCIGIFGPIITIKKAHELIEEGKLSNFKAIAITLKYSEKRRYDFYKWIYAKGIKANERYRMEVEYLNAQIDRQDFICKLANTRKGNTLILVGRREKCGDILYKKLKEISKDRKVFYITGSIKGKIREKIRKFAEDNEVIIIATFRTFSVGINIKNLHNIILGETTKDEIRLIQTIGRELRLHNDKDCAFLYDISDDLRLGPNHPTNYSLKHLLQRIQIYDNEQYEYETKNYTL